VIGARLQDEVEILVRLVPDQRHRRVDGEETALERKPRRRQRRRSVVGDQLTGTPVTNFYRSTRLYNIAMSYNRGLDHDKDGIACEKR
jgi:hypothetical protein